MMRSDWEDIVLRLFVWIAAFLVVGVFAPVINTLVFELLGILAPSVVAETFADSAWIAAILEPFTSKFFPFIATGIVLHGLGFRPAIIRDNLWFTAPLAGLAFGINELFYRNIFKGSEFHLAFWKMSTYQPGQLGPVLLHVITGSVIIWSIYVAKTRKFRVLTGTTGLLGAILIHYVWNTAWLSAMWFWNPFISWVQDVGVALQNPLNMVLVAVMMLFLGWLVVPELSRG